MATMAIYEIDGMPDGRMVGLTDVSVVYEQVGDQFRPTQVFAKYNAANLHTVREALRLKTTGTITIPGAPHTYAGVVPYHVESHVAPRGDDPVRITDCVQFRIGNDDEE